MKYLGVDYLYNLDEKKIAISQFTNRGIECVLLFSQEIQLVEIAISREVLFRELKVPFNEKVYDIFDITSNVNYSIENDDVRITNISFVDTFVSELTESLYHIEINLIGTILFQLEKEKNDLRKILREDALLSGKSEQLNSLFSLELLTELTSYVIRDNKGNKIQEFNTARCANNGFKIICNGIVRYINCLLTNKCIHSDNTH